MIAALLSTVAVAFASAFIPAIPIEPYIVGVVATTGAPPVAVGVAAAVGQTAGKLLIFLSARGLIRSRWLARRTSAKRNATSAGRLRAWRDRLLELLDRPSLQAPIVLLSAAVGIPPLLLVSVYAARTRMTGGVFALLCLAGRAARFVAVAFTPDLIPT